MGAHLGQLAHGLSCPAGPSNEHADPDHRPASAATPLLAMRRGFAQRCPKCGKGTLFWKYLKVTDECPSCGEALHHHRADDAPAYFTIVVVGHFIVGGIPALHKSLAPPEWVQLAIWMPLTLVSCLWLLPRIKARAGRSTVGALHARLRRLQGRSSRRALVRRRWTAALGLYRCYPKDAHVPGTTKIDFALAPPCPPPRSSSAVRRADVNPCAYWHQASIQGWSALFRAAAWKALRLPRPSPISGSLRSRFMLMLSSFAHWGAGAIAWSCP